jgi:DNA invertase Pin-like site-specific DNA recombinase
VAGSGRAVEPALGVAYARFSTSQQSSVEDQHRVNERLAAAAGVRLVRRFQDEALSRSLAEREGVRALIDFVRDHREVQYIVVNKLERITGDLRQRVALADLRQELDLTLMREDGLIEPFDETHQQGADESAVGASAEVRKLRAVQGAPCRARWSRAW